MAINKDRKVNLFSFIIISSVILLLHVLVWFVWYRLAGYSQLTLTAAQIMNLAVGAGMIIWMRLKPKEIGLGFSSLVRAFIILVCVYAAFLSVGWFVIKFGLFDNQLLRDQISLLGVLDNWVLTGLGEEILFCGVLFSATRDLFSDHKRWLRVIIVALLFSLWHLPGYLAIGYSGNVLIGRLAINGVSWLIFGTAYALSGNLWLVVFMHGNTDYPFSPLITDQPVMGIIFMALMMVGAYVIAHYDSLHNSTDFQHEKTLAE